MDLRLAVKREYFEAIKQGKKPYEYRLKNEYWEKRLGSQRLYDKVTITLGYPKSDDASRIMRFVYKGYEIQTITHKHFGDKPVEVFAIILGGHI